MLNIASRSFLLQIQIADISDFAISCSEPLKTDIAKIPWCLKNQPMTYLKLFEHAAQQVYLTVIRGIKGRTEFKEMLGLGLVNEEDIGLSDIDVTVEGLDADAMAPAAANFENPSTVQGGRSAVNNTNGVVYIRDQTRMKLLLKQLQIQLVCRYNDADSSCSSEVKDFRISADGTSDDNSQDYAVPYRKIRELTDEIENLVLVSGVVVQVKPKRHKAVNLLLRCRGCGGEIRMACSSKQLSGHLGGCKLPKKCYANVNNSGTNSVNPSLGVGIQDDALRNNAGGNQKVEGQCPSQNPYCIVSEECEYMDVQQIKLQELSSQVPLGDMPRQIMCCLSRGLVDKLIPGSKISFLGVVICNEMRSAGRGGGGGGGIGSSKEESIKSRYLNIIGYCQGGVVEGANSANRITSEEKEYFHKLTKDSTSIYDMIKQSIAPGIIGMGNSSKSSFDNIDYIKQAISCLMFGGSRKILPDGTKLRGDINVLLLGDPSTAKSQFLKYVSSVAPISIYTSGKGSSAAGLTASVIKDSQNGFTLEAGAMVLADQGVVCIDEFDKMNETDRVAIHEAMEQQTISIAKAGITVVLNTRCSVLAAANPIFGSYDESQSTSEQIDFASSILSRFDLIFLIRDIVDQERDMVIANHLVKLRYGSNSGTKGTNNSLLQPPISVEDMKKFLAYSKRSVDPRLSREAAGLLQSYYISIRQQNKMQAELEGGSTTLPITVRQLEAIARISESFARMELCESVRKDHVQTALELFNAATVNAGMSHRNVSTTSNGSNENPNNAQDSDPYLTEDMKKCEALIKTRVPIGGAIKRSVLMQYLVDQEVDRKVIEKCFHVCRMKRVIEETKGGSYRRLM